MHLTNTSLPGSIRNAYTGDLRLHVADGHRRRVLFKVRDPGQVNAGDELRVAMVEPFIVGRFRVVGHLHTARTGYVIAEPLPGTVIDATPQRAP